MLSSKVQMMLNGRICSLNGHMEKLWSAPTLRLVVKAEPGSWTSPSDPWTSWTQLHGKDAAAGISLVQGRQLWSVPAFLRFLGLLSWRFSWRGVCWLCCWQITSWELSALAWFPSSAVGFPVWAGWVCCPWGKWRESCMSAGDETWGTGVVVFFTWWEYFFLHSPLKRRRLRIFACPQDSTDGFILDGGLGSGMSVLQGLAEGWKEDSGKTLFTWRAAFTSGKVVVRWESASSLT